MPEACKSLIPSTINPDLQKERDTTSFSVEEFAEWWHGGSDNLRLKRQIVNYLYDDAEDDNNAMHSKSYEEIYEESLKKSLRLVAKLRKFQEKHNPGGDDIWPETHFAYFAWGLMPVGNPFEVHTTMLLPALEMQCTAQQWQRFGKRAKNFEITGTYAQTELGHGSFLRGLKTRADYDIKTDEFVLNTPTLQAYKWWPGGLGHSSQFCVIVAQLYINDVHKGLQLFMVPLRDEQTHMPLPGVEIGDIGVKMGLNGVNNGFLALHNVRIPRTNMLMRHAKVLHDGTFIASPVPQLTYFAMLDMRCKVVRRNAALLIIAVTIATRYAAVRRQGSINEGEAECQILDYVTQQHKLLPEIATTVAYNLATQQLLSLYAETRKEIENGVYGRLAELHVACCVLKTLSAYDGSHAVERLRQACGGHGFLSSANLHMLYESSSVSVTYEGENTVMLLQAGRALLKAWRAALEGKPTLAATMRYLENAVAGRQFGQWTGEWGNIVRALQYAAANKVRLAYESVSRRMQNQRTTGEALNESGIELIQAAELHGRAFICATFFEQICGVKSAERSTALNCVLERLLELYLVHTALRYMSDLLRCISLTETDLCALQTRLETVLQQLRPDAVPICDGFDVHDRTLNSTLGCYDGNVYERLYAAAKINPMNRQPVPAAYEKYLKPFLKANL